MSNKTLQSLAPEIQAVVFDEDNEEINETIAGAYGLTNQQLSQVLEVLISVVTKEIPVLEFHVALSKLNLKDVDIMKLALDFALLRLWPLQRYLGDVDRLILRLGGQVPKVVPSIEPVLENVDSLPAEDGALVTTIKDFLEARSENKDLQLTKNYLQDEAGRFIDPTVTNWLKDYLHFAGAEGSDNLIRSQYLVRSINAKQLSEEEKDNILNFLASYNDGTPMRLVVKDGLLTVAEVGEAQPKVAVSEAVNLDQLLQRYHQYVARLQLQLDRVRDGLLLESSGEAGKLADLLWNSIGLGERERALVALVLLAERQQLAELIRSDQRYIGILRRYVNVRFGDRAKSFWQAEWSAVNWTLLLQLLLEDKINLDPLEAPLAAEYLGQVMSLPTPPVYIDLASGQWRWRTVQYADKHFILL